MTSRYSKSTKPAHMRFLRYVELKIEKMEAEIQQHPVKPQSRGYAAPMAAKAKGRPKSEAQPSHDLLQPGDQAETYSQWEMDDGVSSTEMYEAMMYTNVQAETNESIQALQARMLSMENALTRVINHIENTANPQ